MSAGKVDVLAVMDHAERALDSEAQEAREQGVPAIAPVLEAKASALRAARAAVAELIEAANGVGCSYCDDEPRDRLTAALARVQP